MTDKPISTLQDRLKEAMALRGMRAVDLVNASGVSKGSISLYLSGRNIATNDRLYAIAKALRVNPAWLMGYDVEMNDIHSGSLKTTILSHFLSINPVAILLTIKYLLSGFDKNKTPRFL